MKNIKLKRIAASLVLAIFLSVQAAPLAYAATDDQAAASAQKGVDYLESNQKDDGSVAGFGGETEWAIIAVKAAGKEPSAVDNGSGNSLEDFLASDKQTDDTPATSVERKILAIVAAGKDTKDFGGYDYNEKLKTYHNNSQIGDTNLLNDDIFGIIAIKATNDDSLKIVAQDGLNYLLASQKTDGGFSYALKTCAEYNDDWSCAKYQDSSSDSNDTAAAIIALDAAEKMVLINPNLATSKNSAVVYLLSTQNSNGGFGYDIYSDSDGSSTAWALMALNVIGDSVRTEALAARNWLLSNQNLDCGFSYGAYGFNDSDSGTTSHAVIALMGSSWLLDPTPSAAVDSSCAYYDPVVTQPKSEKKPTAKANLATVSSSQTPVNVLSSSTSSSSVNDNQKKSKAVAQVSSASSNKAPAPASATSETKAEPKFNLGIYGAGLLVLIGFGYFVVESLKAKGAK